MGTKEKAVIAKIFRSTALLIAICVPNCLVAACVGDINQDGSVNGLDFAIMRQEMGRNDCSASPCKSDLNSDGVVDDKDKEILKSQYGSSDCLPENKAEPESRGSVSKAVPDESDMRQEPPLPLSEGAQGTLPEKPADKTEPPASSESGPAEEGEPGTSQLTRFKDNGDGTVTDPDTNLMWTKNANLPGESMLFYEALNYIQEMNRGTLPNFGYTDWRLPKQDELRSLVDYTRYTNLGHELPPGHPFENVQLLRFGNFSAGSIYFWMTEHSWFLSLYCRVVGHNVNSCNGFVWPVRDGR